MNHLFLSIREQFNALVPSRLDRTLIVLTLILSGSLFSFIVITEDTKYYGGIPAHLGNALANHKGEMDYKPHFLFYLTLSLITFFSTNFKILKIGGVVILTIAVLFKYFIAKRYFIDRIGETNLSFENKLKVGMLLAGSLMFLHSFPVQISSTMFLGQVMPNLWHNATGIFLIPFALMLYITSKQFLFEKEINKKTVFWIIFFGLMNVFAKPILILPFLPVFPLAAFIISPFGRKFWISVFQSIVIAMPLAGQYLYYYIWGMADSGGREIAVSFFEVWGIWSDNIPLSFIASIPLPLVYLLFFFNRARKDKEFLYSGGIFLVSMILYITFKEKGFEVSQNFCKGAVVANIIFHMVVIGSLAKHVISTRIGNKEILASLVFLAQVFFGIVYFFKIPFFGVW